LDALNQEGTILLIIFRVAALSVAKRVADEMDVKIGEEGIIY
jgi:hypothetical protein